ncbi:MAG: hypothetical protein AAGA60_20100 [Cyanobacteria bacterium P01_E01_bin.42]
MNRLFDFLLDLATSPDKQLAFASNPTQLMEASGLAELDRPLIETALASELYVSAIFFTDPVDDPLPDPDPSDPEEDEIER